jgi:hypothetical protein
MAGIDDGSVMSGLSRHPSLLLVMSSDFGDDRPDKVVDSLACTARDEKALGQRFAIGRRRYQIPFVVNEDFIIEKWHWD